MALIKCVSCNESYSDSLDTCPHCGFAPHIFVCPECGSVYGDANKTCPTCGFQLTGARIPASKEAYEKAYQTIKEKLNSANTEVQFATIKNTLEVLASEINVDAELEECEQKLNDCLELARKRTIISKATELLASNADLIEIQETIKDLQDITDFDDAGNLLVDLKEKCNTLTYNTAMSTMETAKNAEEWKKAQVLFESISDFQDAKEKANKCRVQANTIVAAKKKKKLVCIGVAVGAIVVIAAVVAAITYFIPNSHYNKGIALFNNSDYSGALSEFHSAGNYKDSDAQAKTAQLAQSYVDGETAFTNEDYTTAVSCFQNANGYLDADAKLTDAQLGVHYAKGREAFNSQDYASAIDHFTLAEGFLDAPQQVLNSRYAQAEQVFSNGDYLQAATMFSELNDYEDSVDRIFECAKALLDLESYADASSAFDLINNSDSHGYSQYALGMKAMKDGNYSDAMTAFKNAGKTENAETLYIDASYEQGKKLMGQKDYEGAAELFAAVIEKDDSQDLLNACNLLNAEEYYKKGYLNTAKSLFEKLPTDYSYNGISASERLATLNKHSNFVAMCGKWKAGNGCRIETRQTSRYGSYDYWYIDYDSPNQYLEITCIINSDGTVSVNGTAEMYRYTNYSSLSLYLKNTEFKVNFNKSLSYVPYSTEMTTNFTLTYNAVNSSFSAVNKVINNTESVYFTYTYTSTYTYSTQTAKY